MENVRHFRDVMTHAVDVDGLVWKFFLSAADAEVYAAKRCAEGYDAVVVPAKPHGTTAADKAPAVTPIHKLQNVEPRSADVAFAERLDDLLSANRYNTEDLADALGDEGIVMAREIARRLVNGRGGVPSDSIIDALARVFDVEPEYFFGSETDVLAKGSSATNSDSPPVDDVQLEKQHVGGSKSPHAQFSELAITLQDFGRIIEAMSFTADQYLARSEADTALAAGLTRVLSTLGGQLGRSHGHQVLIPRVVMEELVLAWARTGPSETPSRADFLWAAELLGMAPRS